MPVFLIIDRPNFGFMDARKMLGIVKGLPALAGQARGRRVATIGSHDPLTAADTTLTRYNGSLQHVCTAR